VLKRLLSLLFVGLGSAILLFVLLDFSNQLQLVRAEDEVDQIQREIDELAKLKKLSEDATTPLEAEVANLEARIRSAQAGINNANQQATQLAVNIEEREEDLAYHYQLFANRIAESYRRMRSFNPLTLIFASGNATVLSKNLAYQDSAKAQDDRLIRSISGELKQLADDKRELEETQIRLAALQIQLDEQADFFKGEIEEAKAYQQTLGSKIAELREQQQAILNQRQASLNLPTSLGAGPLYCVDDRKTDPGFGSGFAFFTYGIPHRVGLNQYGAYGRAKSGQKYDQILRAYFNFNEYVNKADITIKVNDSNSINSGNVIWSGSLEEYINRIYEVPESWPLDALKAQAIAARSYVLAVTDNGNKSICANQYCQVFKTEPKGGNWENAVKETAGKVMVADGQVIKAWYASTAGGYTFNSGDVWSTSTSYTKRLIDASGDINSFSDLNERAYDKDSPCFYSAQGWRSQYANSAWLKPSEVADIVNSALLAQADQSLGDYLYQTDKPHPYGREVWNEERVKSELSSRNISPFNTVSSINVEADFSNGVTTKIIINGDAGLQSFSGSEFKKVFNLRAPANIQIVGGLFKVEQR
jgi:SpoIID/LytB domain protein